MIVREAKGTVVQGLGDRSGKRQPVAMGDAAAQDEVVDEAVAAVLKKGKWMQVKLQNGRIQMRVLEDLRS